jgi:putative glycosyltransferase (TIGR04348 family)
MPAAKPVLCIVTPGTKRANNGNWRTAARWARMLRDRYRIIVQSEWDGSACDAMIALHARHSAESIARFHERKGSAHLAVVLTGTDLYRDLPRSAEARRSLDAAGRIVVLQEEALRSLEPRWRRKAEVIFQSAPAKALAKGRASPLRCVAVGHLRVEKDPATLFLAVDRLPRDLAIRIRHIGAPLDPALAAQAKALAARDARYTYSGALPAGSARAAIARAHMLIHPSKMEGGANVVVEAVMSRTPVIASAIPGNVGMLGRKYPGYFDAGDASDLAARLVRACEDPRYLASLRKACIGRRALFAPAAEARALGALARALAG